jgi:hypothetical protein
LQPGQQPTPEQIQAMQRKLAHDAQQAGMSVPEFVEKLKAQAMAQQQAAQQHAAQQQAQQQQQQPQPIQPGPPNPAAIALANFLKGQDLKPRTCILNGQRKDMFKGMSKLRSFIVYSLTPVCSQTCPASHPITCIRKSPQEESTSSRNYRSRLSRELLQAPTTLAARSARL